MYIRIYFGEKQVFLCDQKEPDLLSYFLQPTTIFMEGASKAAIHTLIHEMGKPDIHAGIMISPSLPDLKKQFFKSFHLVKAGGGVVFNDHKEILMILRRGMWDLPKGKLDPGETIENCAVREVKEETGLQQVVLQHPLTDTYHTYEENGKKILKQTHWFCMQATGNQLLFPQTEEDIQEIRWVAPENINTYMRQTYPSIKDVLSQL